MYMTCDNTTNWMQKQIWESIPGPKSETWYYSSNILHQINPQIPLTEPCQTACVPAQVILHSCAFPPVPAAGMLILLFLTTSLWLILEGWAHEQVFQEAFPSPAPSHPPGLGSSHFLIVLQQSAPHSFITVNLQSFMCLSPGPPPLKTVSSLWAGYMTHTPVWAQEPNSVPGMW